MSFPEPHLAIAAYRAASGLSLEAFAAAVGVSSKGRMSEIERGLAKPTPEQALALEEISKGAIDAAALNGIVAQARAACRHGCDTATASPAPSPGENDEDSPSVLNRESVA